MWSSYSTGSLNILDTKSITDKKRSMCHHSNANSRSRCPFLPAQLPALGRSSMFPGSQSPFAKARKGEVPAAFPDHRAPPQPRNLHCIFKEEGLHVCVYTYIVFTILQPLIFFVSINCLKKEKERRGTKNNNISSLQHMEKKNRQKITTDGREGNGNRLRSGS